MRFVPGYGCSTLYHVPENSIKRIFIRRINPIEIELETMLVRSDP